MIRFKPFDYQHRMIRWLYRRAKAALFCSPGLGKTACTLKAFRDLQIEGKTDGMLVVAPRRVCDITWPNEVAKWDFAQDLRIANLRTEEGQQHWVDNTADIYVVNSEQLQSKHVRLKCPVCYDDDDLRFGCGHCDSEGKVEHRICSICGDYEDLKIGCIKCAGKGRISTHYKGIVEKLIKGRRKKNMPVDLLCIDELSLAKSRTSKRFNTLRAYHSRFDRFWGLTGTPIPNSYLDLWAQIRMLDQGALLSPQFGMYRDAYFKNTADPDANYTKYVPVKGAKDKINKRIAGLALSMLSEDYLDIPTCTYLDEELKLPKKAQNAYDEMEREMLLKLERGEINAVNAAVNARKLQQITGGAVYDGDKFAHFIHDAKIAALKKIQKRHPGEPIFVVTQFKHEQDRIRHAFPEAKKFHERDLGAWQAKKIPMWFADPLSMSHGIDGLQQGGRIVVWFSLTYSSEGYIQANARFARTGQAHETLIYRIMAQGTIDEAVADVVRYKGKEEYGAFDALRTLQRLDKEHLRAA